MTRCIGKDVKDGFVKGGGTSVLALACDVVVPFWKLGQKRIKKVVVIWRHPPITGLGLKLRYGFATYSD